MKPIFEDFFIFQAESSDADIWQQVNGEIVCMAGVVDTGK
jgi:hypothetical protein